MEEWQKLPYKDRIKTYQKWLNNKTFFMGYNIAYKYVSTFEVISNSLPFHSKAYLNEKDSELSNISLKDSISLAQEYFDKYNFNINVQEQIDKGILHFDEKEKPKKGLNEDGHNYYDDNGERKCLVHLAHTIIDPVIIVHELLHYQNQPAKKDENEARNFLTEIVSYSNELIFADYLMKEKGIKEAKIIFFQDENSALQICSQLYDVYRFINIYKENGIVDYNVYKKSYNRGYDLMLKLFDEYASTIPNINSSTWNFLGYMLGTYSYEEYKKDPQFLNKINKLNDSMNNKSF